MRMYRALIVDDEQAARRVLRSLLSHHTNLIEIIGEATNGAEAVSMINELKPDLVFLDIQMPGYNGFEVLQKINESPNIIFTTAFEEYALNAFKTFSVDYLLKPIRQEKVDAAMDKLKAFGKFVLPSPESLKKIFPDPERKKQIAFPVKTSDRILLFRYEVISYFEADDKYVALLTTEGKRYLTEHTLAGLSQKLPDNFIRVQKSYIINKEKIKEIHKHFNGRFLIIMDDKSQSRILSGLTFYESIKVELGF